MKHKLIASEYKRFCKDTSDAGYEKAMAEIIEEQAQEDFRTQTELLTTVLEERTEAKILSISPCSGTEKI